jgi:uncharacterized protein (DUF983 family)
MTTTPLPSASEGLCPPVPRCPRTLFAGLISLPPLPRCGLDFAAFNVGDGRRLLIFGVGGLVTALAIWLELASQPALVACTSCCGSRLSVALTLAGLRLAKAGLLTRVSAQCP